MNIFKNNFIKLTILSLFIVTSLTVATTALSAEDIIDRMNKSISGIDLINSGEDSPDDVAQNIIGNIIGAFLSVLGVIFMILLIYGGFRWMNARGNEDETKKARDIIFQATIGLIIVMSAYAISFFISAVVANL